MRIDVRHNIGRMLKSIVRVQSDIKDKATVRALNRTAETVRSATSREIRKVYKIKASAVRAATKLKRASLKSRILTAEVKISGRRISLIEFSARAVNPWNLKGRRHRRTGGGVSVQVKVAGGRKVVKSAFIATTKTGYRGVFIREGVAGAPRKTGGQYRGQGEAIVNLRSISLPSAFVSKAVNEALRSIAIQTFNDRFQHELQFILRK